MRPLRLSVTAFGPYAGTEVVDFDALTELGLFVVAGNNGAGKTTIFDALHYSLFGTLPGRRATYIRLKSDHADDTVECKVVLDFTAHGKQWRVERSPKQKRPKKRGTGFTEVDRRATLYRLDHGQAGAATAIANKIGEVDEKCRELVGLSGKQFERVALLPQGEFSRVLRESSTDRRELLRTLFSSEIFGDATSLLTDEAAQATAADRSVLDRLDHQQAGIATALTELAGYPVAGSVADIQGALTDIRRVQLATLTTQAADAETASNAASRAHQSAIDTAERLERRRQIEHEYRSHQATTEQHDQDVSRLERGRAAVPVTNLIRATNEQEQRHERATERVEQLLARLNRALIAAGLPAATSVDPDALTTLSTTSAELAKRLQDHHEAAAHVRDLEALTNQCQGELRRTTNEITNLNEQMSIAQSRLRQLRAENETLEAAADLESCERELGIAQAELHQRVELESLDHQHQQLMRRSTEFEATIAQIQNAHEQACQARTALPTLQQKANDAFVALEASTERRQAASIFATATARLADARAEQVAASSRATQIWDAFISGTAARVAEALVADEPCPVCGSEEHPEPATFAADDQVATQDDVSNARAQADLLHDEVRKIENQIEGLLRAHDDIADLSLTDAAAEITTAKAMALGARTRADDARTAASQRDHLAGELERTRREHADLDAELRSIDQRSNQLQGALGQTVNETVLDLRSRVERAEHDRATAERRAVRGIELAQALAAATDEIETIGIGQIAAEGRRTTAVTQLAEREHEFTAAAASLQMLIEDLTPAASASTAHNFEHRAQAVRHATELIVELGTAAALQHETTDGIRRARSLLADRIGQSPFASTQAALDAFVEPHIIDQLESQTTTFIAAGERFRGQLQALADLPQAAPDRAALKTQADLASQAFAQANRELITLTTSLDRLADELDAIVAERQARQTGDLSTRRLERVAALVKGDNDRNTSLENWVLAAHLRDVVELANLRLARSTHQRFQLCVLDDGENKRGKWGLDLGVEDTVTGTRRPTAGLSGGELFQASLALALGLADAVMNQTAGVRIDALFIDEGFGSLDEVSVERAIDLLDELRDRGAMVGVITHVPALLDALPLGVHVVDAPDGHGSTIRQSRLAA